MCARLIVYVCVELLRASHFNTSMASLGMDEDEAYVNIMHYCQKDHRGCLVQSSS